MTTYNKATLKTFFEQGDVPTGTNYADFIDSNVNLVETAEQVMAGPLYTTELITPLISANSVAFGGTTFAVNVGSNMSLAAGGAIVASAVGNLNLNGGNQLDLRGGELSTGNRIFLGSSGNMTITSNSGSVSITAAAGGNNINLNSQVVASALRVTTNVTASTIYSTNGIISPPAIVSAAGTAQATAAVLTGVINRGKGVVDGSTTGFTPLANRAGLTQYLYNEGASANLWPPTGGTINGLAANAVFPLAASAMVTIVHLTASAYAVK